MSRGIVLIHVLWSLLFASFVLMYIASSTYFYRVALSRIDKKYMQVLEMFAVADGVLTEMRNKIPLSEKPLSLLKEEKNVVYQGRGYVVRIEPEDAKLSVNLYGGDAIERLLILIGFERRRAKEIADNIVLYRETKGARFLSMAQLKSYMKEEEYERIRPYLTVVPLAVNINYAEPVVLEALGFRREDVVHILRMREERGYVLLEDIKRQFPEKEGSIRSLLSSRFLSEYFMITVETKENLPKLKLSCILNKIGDVIDCGDAL